MNTLRHIPSTGPSSAFVDFLIEYQGQINTLLPLELLEANIGKSFEKLEKTRRLQRALIETVTLPLYSIAISASAKTS